MKNKPLICDKSNLSEAYLSRMFSWLTRIGVTPKFGTCNIAYYQMRQVTALCWLEQSEAAGYPLRCHNGMIQYKPSGCPRRKLITVQQLQDISTGGFIVT